MAGRGGSALGALLGACALLAGLAGVARAAVPVTTLDQALANAYANNPTLQAERAKLRATDENVPAALAGWRPTIQLSGSAGYAAGTIRQPSIFGGSTTSNESRSVVGGTGTLTQPLFHGGKTHAQLSQARNQVRSEVANLLATEEQVFQQVVQAYVGVIQAEQVLRLNRNNEMVLRKELQAVEAQFQVGELTRTDVAQAEAALAGATAQRETAQGNLDVARATFRQLVGVVPGALVPPQPLVLPVKSQADAERLASDNNPNVVAALFSDAAAKDAINVAWSALLPTLSLQGTVFDQENQSQRSVTSVGGQVVANLTVPLYQGGAEYATIRQARQSEQQALDTVFVQRRAAVSQAAQAWNTLVSARAAVLSTRAQIKANLIALEGVEREELVGSRTILDVLNAVQALLSSQVTLVQNLASVVNASYQVAGAIGRLTARDLNLQVPLYDPYGYFEQVHNAWIGTGSGSGR